VRHGGQTVRAEMGEAITARGGLGAIALAD
jgi:hypothetical protein